MDRTRLLVALAGVLVLLVLPQVALANNCLVDGHGAATDGPLCCNNQVYDKLAYINESDWSGNLAYDANRYDSGGTQTYHEYVSSGPWEYGTSGNTYRETAIQRGGYSSMSSWEAVEYALC
jgi:hypothetical protein